MPRRILKYAKLYVLVDFTLPRRILKYVKLHIETSGKQSNNGNAKQILTLLHTNNCRAFSTIAATASAPATETAPAHKAAPATAPESAQVPGSESSQRRSSQ